MSAIFAYNDGAANAISFRIVNNVATPIVDTTGPTTGGAIQVPRFEINENSGGTPSITVDLYNPTTTELRYLGSGGVTYAVKALTAYQSVVFEGSYVVPNGWQLRVTSNNAGGLVDVIGIKAGRGRDSGA